MPELKLFIWIFDIHNGLGPLLLIRKKLDCYWILDNINEVYQDRGQRKTVDLWIS